MEVEKIWNESQWTEAHQIINGLKQFKKDSKILLILRHSERDEIEDLKEMQNLKLTPNGHAIAKKFGEVLPKERSIRLFHSAISRCQETADDILTGFKTKGGIGKINGIFDPLYKIEKSPDFFPRILEKYDGVQFINRWAAGLFSQDQIISLQKYCQKAANLIWNEYKNSSDRNIDIHVTHDLIIIALRLGWFGIPPGKDWISFLGGFALTFEKNNILLLEKNSLVFKEIPYWWNF